MRETAVQRLKESKELIFKSWETEARQTVNAARRQDKLALRDGLPLFFEKLTQALDPTEPIPTQDIIDVAKEHAEERANIPIYSIDQVLLEYDLLRQTIFVFIEKEVPLSKLERDIILKVFSTATSEAAAQFMNIQLEFEKSSKTEIENANLQLQQEKYVREKFVLTLTHDLRTPLTAAKLATELLSRSFDSTIDRKQCSKIIRSITRADQMIQDLLDANLLKAGEKISLKIARVDLAEVIRNTLDDLTTVLGNRFILQTPQKIDGYLDPYGIRRTIENLCSNAVKYGDPIQPIIVTLKIIKNDVCISVFNEGRIISVEEQKSIFNEFWRSKSAKASGKNGWGIGLTLVHGIVEAHKGRVGVKSIPGEGTTFIVIFPLDAREESSGLALAIENFKGVSWAK